MNTSRCLLLLWTLTTLMLGCRSDVDSPCTVDSDCASGLWCSPHAQQCVEIDCEDGLCTAPDGTLFPTGSDRNGPRTGTDGPKVTPLCNPTTGQAWTVTSFLVGTSGEKGQGIDVDQDPSTCDGIDGECSDGIDNSFSRLASLVNTFMSTGVSSGDIRLTLHIPESVDVGGGEEACTHLTILRLLDSSSVSSMSFLPGSGAPASDIGEVESTETQLNAGPDGVFVMPLAVLGAVISVELNQVALQAERKITVNDDGSVGETLQVVLGGAMTRAALETAILALPASAAERAGLSRQAILDIIQPLLEEDLETDIPEARKISIGLTMEAERSNPWDIDAGQFDLSTGLKYALCQTDDEGLPCNDGNPCTLGDTCLDGECAPGLINVCECSQDADCAATDDLCDGVDVCGDDFTCAADPSTAPAPCDTANDNDCAVSLCEPTTGECVLETLSDGMLCEDSDPCWTVKACESGVCQGLTWNMSTCEEEECTTLGETMCEDGIACTVDFCTEAEGCTTILDNGQCDDDDPCTGDSCDPTAANGSGCTHEVFPNCSG